MNILLTKKLSPSSLSLIRSWGWNFEVIETLNITAVEVGEIQKADAWVVSSRNSSDAVMEWLDDAPQNIYCVGDWMKEELVKAGAKSTIRSFENMDRLAKVLEEEEFQSILYFCGDHHRTDLEEALRGSGARLYKVITHKSEMTFPSVKNNFDAVFVFSPRSAESLLANNAFQSETVFACIGSTTAAYLNDRGIDNTFTCSYPDSRILLEEFHDQIVKK